MCDSAPVALLSNVDPEHFTGLNDHEVLRYERSELLRKAVQEGGNGGDNGAAFQ